MTYVQFVVGLINQLNGCKSEILVARKNIVQLEINVITEMSFELLVAVRIKIIVSWDVAPCNIVQEYQRYGETCCLHLQCGR
jgi:hypothetical protein